MNATDPRHGTVAGHNVHQRSGEPACPACIAAKTLYDKRRRYDALRGFPRTVSSLGARRRFQSLQAIGWSRVHIAKAAGWKTTGSLNYLMRNDTITRATHERMAIAFESLAMKQPPNNRDTRRTRTWAAKHGHVSPLAWDDIDDPDARPVGLRRDAA